MKLEQLPIEFQNALPILNTITKAGYEAYFVGGSVRDTILAKPIHDVDIASSAYPAEVKQLFKRTVDTGIQHGTVMVLDHGSGYEVTTFRTEGSYQDFRRPDKVTFVRSLSEDLKRRDFTINALAMNADGVVTDLFGGIEDLDRHVIRAVGEPTERFHEDALRMMRAVRFSSQLDFTIDTQTNVAIQEQSELLTKIAMERIHEEFVKLMLGQAANRGVAQLITTDLYHYLPGLDGQQVRLQQMAERPFQLATEGQVWSYLAVSLGLAAEQINSWLRDWKTANKTVREVIATVQLLTAIQAGEVNNWELYSAGLENVKNAILVSDQLGYSDQKELLNQYNQLPIATKKQLVISGTDLIKQAVVQPGPNLGKVLDHLERQVVAGKLANEPADLTAAAQDYVMEITK